MSKPILLVFAALTACLLPGCEPGTGSSDAEVATFDTPAAAGRSETAEAERLPVAPMPREKRKASEIIVGKWQVVWAEGPIPETSDFTFEFLKNANVRMLYLIKGQVDLDGSGTYKMTGDTVTISMGATRNDGPWTEDFKIQSINEREIVISCPPSNAQRDRTPVKFVLRRDGKK